MSQTFNDSFKDIEIALEKLRDREFKIFNIQFENKVEKKEFDPNKISFDAKKIGQKISMYKKKRRKKGVHIKNENIVIGNDLANMKYIQTETDRKRWTELSKIEKKKQLIDYLDTLSLDNELYDIILKRRILKKDVEFNIFEQKIESLNFLIIEDNKYKMKISKKKVKKAPKIFK